MLSKNLTAQNSNIILHLSIPFEKKMQNSFFLMQIRATT